MATHAGRVCQLSLLSRIAQCTLPGLHRASVCKQWCSAALGLTLIKCGAAVTIRQHLSLVGRASARHSSTQANREISAAAAGMSRTRPKQTVPPGSAADASSKPRQRSGSTKQSSSNGNGNSNSQLPDIVTGPHVVVSQPLPHVLILHTGGTLGMDVQQSFEAVPEHPAQLLLKKGTGGSYKGLVPGDMLTNLFQQVPELCKFANLDLQVVFNKDSSNVGPKEWTQIAKLLDKNRQAYDAFLVVHGTDTMAYTASAISLMLQGFKKPVVFTGSQLPLSSPRSDARQNLIDALTCATAAAKPPHVSLQEVAVCFGGKLMRGNRTRKVNSSNYQAFDSPGYPHLAALGVDVDWNERYLLRVEGGYQPRCGHLETPTSWSHWLYVV
eukprot:GHRR01029258.1.p1 GENE.GHRR01029258.1~~GHRR01029258.1.p1  ORF type:complete len:383 (+),score=131.02 GHRR01029258.1:795-1943(+)